MIGYIKGSLIEADDVVLLVDVGGVGYEVFATNNSLAAALNNPGQIGLWIHMVVREDSMQLYGFSTKQERLLFRELIKISGVGPKVALSILSGMELEQLVRSVRAADSAALTSISGIGKKTAERLVIELRDRLKNFADVDLVSSTTSSGTATDHGKEAEAALIALGYRPVEAGRMIAAVGEDVESSVEAIIREALKAKR